METIAETIKDPVECLLNAAKTRPTDDVRDQLIDLEVDTTGRWVGFDAANHIWHIAIPD